MDWRQRGRDRRHSARFEVVGVLPGTVVAPQYTTIRNCGSEGLLVEGFWPPPVAEPVAVKVLSAVPPTLIRACVRHVGPSGTDRCLIGLEFTTSRSGRLDQ